MQALNATAVDVSDPAWYIDSGATHHVSSNINHPQQLMEYKGNGKLLIGNGKCMKITKIGATNLPLTSNSQSFTLNNILVVPKISKNLVSV